MGRQRAYRALADFAHRYIQIFLYRYPEMLDFQIRSPCRQNEVFGIGWWSRDHRNSA